MRLESVFNFRDSIEPDRYFRFLFSLYESRRHFAPQLQAVEGLFESIPENEELLDLLRRDLKVFEFDPEPGDNHVAETSRAQDESSWNTGVYYVFAGSSAGARWLCKLIKISPWELPVSYISRMERTSGNQLKSLEALFRKENLDERIVIHSAQLAFEFIHAKSFDAPIRRNQSFESA